MDGGNLGQGAGSSAQSTSLKTSFEVESKVEALYRGGKAALSEDGSRLFCTCSERINIVDVSTGAITIALQEDEDELSCFALAPDQQFIVSAGKSLLLRQWSLDTFTVNRKWKSLHLGPILAMVFDSTSTLLATGSSDGTIKVWDIVKQYCTHNLTGSQGVISLLAFHPDPSKLQLISAASDCKIRLWSLEMSRCAATFEGHFSAVTAVDFTEDKKYMISTAGDKVMIFWDLDLRSQIKTIPVFEGMTSVVALPRSLKLSCAKDADKQYLLIGGEKGIIQIRSFPDGKRIHSLPLWPVENVNSSFSQPSISKVLFSATAEQFAVTTFDHNIVLYNAATLEQTKQLVGNYDEVLDVKFMGSDDEIIAIATNSEQIKVLSRTDWNCQILAGHSETVLALDVSSDHQYIASCSKDNTIRIWSHVEDDQSSFKCVAVGQGHTHAVGAISWPKIKTTFLVSASQDLTIKAWSIPSVFTDGTCHSLTVKWTEKAHDKDINSIAISPNDKLIATASQDRTAKIWQAASGGLLATLRGHKRGVWCIVFSPVDQCVATCSGDATIRIWTLSDFTCVKTFEEHTNSVLRVCFLSSGMQLVSSGSDGLVKLWTVRTNECIETLDSHSDKVWALAVSKSEKHMVSGGSDALINLWKDVTEEKKQALESKQEETLLQEQELANLLQQKQFSKAVRLALTLEKPHHVLCILKDMLKESNGVEQIEATLLPLRQDQLDLLVKFMCDWNTNAKHCVVTQTVLSILLKHKSPEELEKFDEMKDRLEALLPYTERHFERINRLLRQSTFLDYTLQSMKLGAMTERAVPLSPSVASSHPCNGIVVSDAQTKDTFMVDTVPSIVDDVAVDDQEVASGRAAAQQLDEQDNGNSKPVLDDNDDEKPCTPTSVPKKTEGSSTKKKKKKKKRLSDVTNAVEQPEKTPSVKRRKSMRIANGKDEDKDR